MKLPWGLKLYQVVGVGGLGLVIGHAAWATHSPFVLIVTMATAIGCIIGGVMGCWPYIIGGNDGRLSRDAS